MNKNKQIKGMAQPNRGSVGNQEALKPFVGWSNEEVLWLNQQLNFFQNMKYYVESKLKEKK